ncbi:P-loop containing nucleoside triphosphate hydrolase protein [Chytridium lagenaria]|nr:P-loop containing nucleoside triphosphate hydrolase protein [Chytridium lagenaria]
MADESPKEQQPLLKKARILKAISKLGFSRPTLVQASAIPLALQGARTGSGKTLAYCIPLIQKILGVKESLKTNESQRRAIRGLILVPTKELAEQVSRAVKDLSVYLTNEISIVSLANADATLNSLRPILLEKPDIVVGTPARIMNHIEAENMYLKESLETLIIDEADLILSYGHDEDVRKILGHLPQIHQSLLMSATVSADVQQLKQLLEDEGSQEDLLTQYHMDCGESDKFLITFFLLKLKVFPFGSGKTIIFVNDTDRCYKLKLFLEQFGIKSCALNAELPLKSRYHIVQEFNRGIYDIIIATDEAEMEDDEESSEAKEEPATGQKRRSASESGPSDRKRHKGNKDSEYGVSRGVDFRKVQAVINFDLPRSGRSYMHRIGRTARGVGNKGWALSFVVPKDKAPTMVLPKGKSIADMPSSKVPVGALDEIVFERIVKKQEDYGRKILPFTCDPTQVSAFKYRVEDAMKAVTKTAIKEARLKEIKQEILNSEKLKAHFEDNPKDLQALRHDKPLHPSRVQSHMKHVPDYLMPKRSTSSSAVGHVPFRMDSKRKVRGKPRGGGQASGSFRKPGKKSDPLKVFKKK